MSDKLICKTCIALPMCKSWWNRYPNRDIEHLVLYKLSERCSIIKNYAYNYPSLRTYHRVYLFFRKGTHYDAL
jgi:hypothetical protein